MTLACLLRLAALAPIFQVSGRPGVRTDLTFVPAGHDFRGSQKPRALTRTTYFYVDPRGPLADPALRFGEIEFKPRLFFYDRGLWGTALKLKSLVENPGSMQRQYAEAPGR
jgi:AraC family transcriptional regulator